MIGKKLGNRYEILSQIGTGGMAVVYRARDNILNRMVAIKILKNHLAGDEDFVRRFKREAQAAAGLSHPNIVSIYDVGKEEETHFIVMEYVEGVTLKEEIKSREKFEPRKAVEIVLQVANALQNAHSSGVIHRDIKPQNILISRDGQVKVTDFGIAVAANAAGTLTYSHTVVGSVHYFSPEQASGEGVGEQSDVYSLGIVLYEMLTGKLPYSGDSPISVALKHINEDVLPPRELNPEVPESLENIVLKLVQKDPGRRYQNVDELKRDLSMWQEGKEVKVDNSYQEQVQQEEEEWEGETMVSSSPGSTKNGSKKGGKKKEKEKEAAAAVKNGNHKKSRQPFWKKKWFIALVVLFIGTITGLVWAGISYLRVPEVTTPALEEKNREEAKELLREAGFVGDIEIEEGYHDEIPEGYVFEQEPREGRTVKEHRTVELVISKGPGLLEVPDLVGMNELEIQHKMEHYEDIQIERKDLWNEEVPQETVIRQSPQSGASVEKDMEIVIYVSKGPPPFPMDDMTGKTLEEAEEYLEEKDLVWRTQYESSEEPEDEVIDQEPAPGFAVEAGERVTLVLSRGEEDEEEEDEDKDEDQEDGEDEEDNSEKDNNGEDGEES